MTQHECEVSGGEGSSLPGLQSHVHHRFIIYASLPSHPHNLHPREQRVVSVLIPLWLIWKHLPGGLDARWFIHVQTHDLLKHTQSVNPSEEVKDAVHSRSSLPVRSSAPVRIQPWRLISRPDQTTQTGITERMLRLVIPRSMQLCNFTAS